VVIPLDVFERIWNEVTGGAPLLAPQISISVPNVHAIEGYVRQLRELLPDCTVLGIPATAAQASARGLPEGWSDYRRAGRTEAVVTGEPVLPVEVKYVMVALTGLLAALLVASNSLIILTQRQREIGVLRALGAKRRDIMAMVLSEIVTVSLLGSLIGYGGIRLAYIRNQITGRLAAGEIVVSALRDGALVVGICLLCAGLFGLIPAVRSTAVSTSVVLRQE
jgi:predicted lysophospholipase L1 biosynthesis ABC-type transport system permease subunit